MSRSLRSALALLTTLAIPSLAIPSAALPAPPGAAPAFVERFASDPLAGTGRTSAGTGPMTAGRGPMIAGKAPIAGTPTGPIGALHGEAARARRALR